MRSIGFAPDLVKLIRGGQKTLTYRLGDKYDFLKTGDSVEVRDSSTDKSFGLIEIIEKSYSNFIDLSIKKSGHEAYKSKKNMRETFIRYYNQPIADNDKFIVLGFKLLKLY